MNHLLANAFVDELEKLAAGPLIIEHSSPDFYGLFFERKRLERQLRAKPEVAEIWRKDFPQVFKTSKDVVFLPSRDALRGMGIPEGNIEPAYKMTRRHELTHWKRAKRGKFRGVGEPGLRNVLRSYREEAIAHAVMGRPLEGRPEMLRQLKKTLVQSTHDSVSTALYGPTGGVRKAALGGTASKILKALKRFR